MCKGWSLRIADGVWRSASYKLISVGSLMVHGAAPANTAFIACNLSMHAGSTLLGYL